MTDFAETHEPRLPFPTRPLKVHGGTVEEYVIPDEKRAEVLEKLYPFEDIPSRDDERFDLHEGKLFKVREFRVAREQGMNFLVSPYYPHSGGSVIDWMPPEFADDEEKLSDNS